MQSAALHMARVCASVRDRGCGECGGDISELDTEGCLGIAIIEGCKCEGMQM